VRIAVLLTALTLLAAASAGPGLATGHAAPRSTGVLTCAKQGVVDGLLCQREWLRTQKPTVDASKIADGTTFSVLTYPSAAKQGATCVEFSGGEALGTTGFGCKPTKTLFASRPLLVGHGVYVHNKTHYLGLSLAWGYASPQVKTIDVLTASGRTVAVAIVNHTFVYTGASGAAPVVIFARNAEGRTIVSEELSGGGGGV
jgi:hypothetical protein